MFTRSEAVFFNFLLCAFNALADHISFNHFTILETKTIHYGGDAF